MARRLKEERHGSWASTQKNPTGDSCSVAGALPTSFSQSVTPFPRGLWGCILRPASLCPELLWGAPQLSHGAHLPHSGKKKTKQKKYCKILITKRDNNCGKVCKFWYVVTLEGTMNYFNYFMSTWVNITIIFNFFSKTLLFTFINIYICLLAVFFSLTFVCTLLHLFGNNFYTHQLSISKIA